tara:strand:+ start:151 stop:417 length:267 start_codon:yes stop_codon:yes gene_type:complete
MVKNTVVSLLLLFSAGCSTTRWAAEAAETVLGEIPYGLDAVRDDAETTLTAVAMRVPYFGDRFSEAVGSAFDAEYLGDNLPEEIIFDD